MTTSDSVSLIIPVKRTALAKSRLALNAAMRSRVATRMAVSTTQTALRAATVARVLVVTPDEDVVKLARGLGADVLVELEPTGLNAAAELGRCWATDVAPGAPVAILVADLPLLVPEELDEAVAQFRILGPAMYVADQHGLGTTMLIHDPSVRPGISFGERSASRHARLDYLPCPGGLPGLRGDLDTLDDLEVLCRRTEGRSTEAHAWLTASMSAETRLPRQPAVPATTEP